MVYLFSSKLEQSIGHDAVFYRIVWKGFVESGLACCKTVLVGGVGF
jgi:hypothetical protein